MSEKTNNSLAVSFGLLPVSVRLELIGEHNGATAVARSCLVEGQRVVRVGLCQDHLLVNRALARADTLSIRFLVSWSLVEFVQFWGGSRDGSAVRNELKRLSGFTPGDQAWGSGFASRLAICESMRVIDSLPIYAREPQRGPFTLLELELPMRSPSDVTNWRAKNGQTETVKPIPPRVKATKVAVASAQVIAPPPDPYFAAFHETARSALDEATFQTLEDLTRGAANA